MTVYRNAHRRIVAFVLDQEPEKLVQNPGWFQFQMEGRVQDAIARGSMDTAEAKEVLAAFATREFVLFTARGYTYDGSCLVFDKDLVDQAKRERQRRLSLGEKDSDFLRLLIPPSGRYATLLATGSLSILIL